MDRVNKVLVLSDVDGTLVKGSIVIGHACFLHDKGVFDFGTLPWRWRRDKKNEAIIGELANEYRKAIVGKSVDELLVDEYIEHVLRQKKFYSSLKRILEIQNDGAEVVLVTGSPDFLVNKFAEEFGFKAISASYETVDGVFTGKFDAMHGSDAKMKAIKQLRLKRFNEIISFGDTPSDKPLLDVAGKRFLVDPTAETMEILKDFNAMILEK